MSWAHASQSQQSQLSLDVSIIAPVTLLLSSLLFSSPSFCSSKYSPVISTFLRTAPLSPSLLKQTLSSPSFLSCPWLDTWLYFCALLFQTLFSRVTSCSLLPHLLVLSSTDLSILYISRLLPLLASTILAFLLCTTSSSSRMTHFITSPLTCPQKYSLSSHVWFLQGYTDSL